MATVHVQVSSESAVNRIADWANKRTFEYYVAPKPTSNRADHVTLNRVDPDGLAELRGFIKANGLKCTIEVE